MPDKIVIANLATDVLEFLAEQIDSVPHLEALLLLYKQTAGQWTVELTAARLYVSAVNADQILRDLERRKLVSRSFDDGATVYAYDPEWDETGQLMARVAMTYSSHLTAVSAYIHSKASRSVLEFARAFKFKKD